VTIKHHYYINPADTSSFERLNSERVIEAIKAQLKSLDYKKYLGELANKNSREIPLRDFICSVAQNLSKENKNFVIIIDGLDHVVREKDVYELKDFLILLYHIKTVIYLKLYIFSV
jgi:Cdc6-like AAA superfamily ATPase